jgi:RNA polymerase sigma-70 factor (ECF subfamily)
MSITIAWGLPRWRWLLRMGRVEQENSDPSLHLVEIGSQTAQQRAQRSFEDFYAANFSRLVVQLYGYTGDLAEAQDVVQEAFSRAWPRWSKLERYDEPAAWIRRVAWNLATSRWRRVRTMTNFVRRQRVEDTPEPSPDRVEMSRALAQLPENHRKAVVLHHLAGMSVADIATECGVPEGTVKSWLHRGRATLATYFTGTEYPGEPS